MPWPGRRAPAPSSATVTVGAGPGGPAPGPHWPGAPPSGSPPGDRLLARCRHPGRPRGPAGLGGRARLLRPVTVSQYMI